MKKKITIGYIVWGNITQTSTFYTSKSSGLRHRMLVPLQHLVDPYKVTFIRDNITPDSYPSIFQEYSFDIIVFLKSFNKNNIDLLKFIKKHSACKVIFDMCDNHFARAEYKEHYIQMCNESHVVTASAKSLMPIIADITNKDSSSIHLIEDPLEYPTNDAHFNRNTLLWYGNTVNFQPLCELLPHLSNLSLKCPMQITIIINNPLSVKELVKAYHHQNLHISLLDFSQEAMRQSLLTHDIVILPTLQGDFRLGKSSNRLCEAINAGAFVVANPLPSYIEFSNFAMIQDNIIDGLEWALLNRTKANNMIHQGQAYIKERYSQKKIAHEWNQLFQSLLDS